MSKEQVNHPSHYCQHPAGIECIDVIRHYVCDIANAIKYLWRAGLKAELGKDDADKEIEDLHKALWYIEDYRSHSKDVQVVAGSFGIACKVIDYNIVQLTQVYDKHVGEAMGNLLQIGLIYENSVVASVKYTHLLNMAARAIQQRIIAIEKQLVKHEIDETLDVLHGVSHKIKPACKRETEPADYDPMNLIIIHGTAYGLTSEVRKKDNGGIYNPCELCDLQNECFGEDATSLSKMFCDRLHQAADNEYYRSVGRADYRPADGAILIIDEQKELEKELRELEEE